MYEQLFDNGDGRFLTSNEMVLENALDTEGFYSTVECPECGKEAKEKHFDECHGGCINSISSTDCPHCGYHTCGREFCSECESHAEIQNHLDFEAASRVEMKLDFLICELKVIRAASVNPVMVTEMKLELLSNSDVHDWFELLACACSRRSPINHIKRELCNAKFARNLALKIDQAKRELA